MNHDDLINLGIAFGLGLLVGLQREKSNHKMAGVRTFTLVAMLGTLTGILSRDYHNDLIIPAFVMAVTAVMVISNYMKSRQKPDTNVGITTEMSVLLIFAIGSYLVVGSKVIGVIAGGTLVILLYIKETLHGFIDRLNDKELSAIMTFVGISLIILPILPNEDFGPYKVLNPREIWLMVTLIVGISVLGYFLYKSVGPKAGMISNGIIGGMISSTATTVSYSRSAAQNTSISPVSAFVILSATTISIVRVLIEIGVVIPQKLSELYLPLLVFFGFMVLVSVLMYFYVSRNSESIDIPEPDNPAQFKTALFFGLLYAIILLAVAFVTDQWGNNSLYMVSIIGGLPSVDATTLSLAQSMRNGLSPDLGWRLILAGVLSNAAFKIVLVSFLGSKKLAVWLGGALALTVGFGVLLILFWPK